MAQFLLSRPEHNLFLLSERFSQDPLENYFGKQRGRCGRNEHPTFQQCITNASALRVQRSVALDPVRGNCRRKRQLMESEELCVDNTPLPKRKRNRAKH